MVQNMLEKFSTIKEMGREFIIMQMAINMLASGRKTDFMEKEFTYFPMEKDMKEI